MSVMHIDFFSRSLLLGSSMNVILPEIDVKHAGEEGWDGNTQLSVLYLLHGVTDDHTSWCRRTSIERYVAGKKLAVIMPNAANSFYTDELRGYKYWEFISEELPEIVRSYFKISDKRQDTYVAGLSMGSYGAAKLALNYPGRYCKAALLSGGIFLLDGIRDLSDLKLRIFGEQSNITGSINDLPYIAKKLTEKSCEKPEFFTACGKNDYLYDMHKRMVPYLTGLGYSVTNHEEEGAAHNWAFWDKVIQTVLKWMDIK